METLITLGGALKAFDDGRVEGLLVPFGGPEDLDLDGEWFDAQTDFDRDLPTKVSTYFDHGQDETLGRTRFGKAEIGVGEDGVWFRGQLDLADRYGKRIHELAQKGVLRLSSGAAPHIVVREKGEKGTRIARWPIVEASYTVHPANPNAGARAVKNADEWMKERVSFEAACAEAILPPSGGATKSSAATTLAEHSGAVVSAVRGYVERVEDRAAFRLAVDAKSGRMLSGANVTELEAVLGTRDTLNEMFGRIEALLAKARPKEQDETADTQASARKETEQLRTQTLRLLMRTPLSGAQA